jgi:hypothetical protein
MWIAEATSDSEVRESPILRPESNGTIRQFHRVAARPIPDVKGIGSTHPSVMHSNADQGWLDNHRIMQIEAWPNNPDLYPFTPATERLNIIVGQLIVSDIENAARHNARERPRWVCRLLLGSRRNTDCGDFIAAEISHCYLDGNNLLDTTINAHMVGKLDSWKYPRHCC